jgi:hypothetical protein
VAADAAVALTAMAAGMVASANAARSLRFMVHPSCAGAVILPLPRPPAS